MTVSIQEEAALNFSFDYKQAADRAVRVTLDYENFPFEAEVNLLLTDNQGIHALNKAHRQIDAPTDVLSFPMIRFEKAGDFSDMEADPDNFNPDTGEAVLGDIIISAQKAAEQAADYGHSELREFTFLIVHSMLHLLGYDHMQEEDASVMEARQRAVFEAMNITRE